MNTFPEGGATGANVTNLQTAGFCGSTCNLSFAYIDLGKALPANGSITITASGVGAGTALYAEVLNSKGQIIYITGELGIRDHWRRYQRRSRTRITDADGNRGCWV